MPEVASNTTPEIPLPPVEQEPAQFETAREVPSPAPEQVSSDVTPVDLPSPAHVVTPPVAVPYEMQIQKQVENILSEGLEQVYQGLDAATKAKVKMTGEQTAAQITILLQETKLQIKKILQLIIAWLKGFPGLNKHYVEQAAKIKADKLFISRSLRS